MTDITLASSQLAKTYEQYIAQFLDDLDVAQKTRDTYRRSLRQYFNFLLAHDIELNTTDRQTVLSYKRELEQTKAASTVNAYLTAVRRFYAWCESLKIYPNVAAGIKSEKIDHTSPKQALTVEQAKNLLSARPDLDNLTELRDYAIVNLMLRRGLRTVEIARANIEDVQIVAGESVLYIQGKGYKSKSQMIVLREECYAPIRMYLKARGDVDKGEPLFASTSNRCYGGRLTTRSVSRLVAQTLDDMGYKSDTVTAHSLRHTAVTLSLIGGATPQQVQGLARHSSIETTFIYAHNIERMQAHAEKSIDSVLAIA